MNQTVEVKLIEATLVLIFTSGVIGLLGASKRWSDVPQWFFITQIWSVSTVFSRAPHNR